MSWSSTVNAEDEEAKYTLPEGYFIDVEQTPTGNVSLVLQHTERPGYIEAISDRIVVNADKIPASFAELCKVGKDHADEKERSTLLLRTANEFAEKYSLR